MSSSQPLESDPEGTKPETAPAPFNKTTANVILRTSDHVDFYVQKAILIESSQFFEDMFSLFGHARDQKVQDGPRGISIIPVAESSETLDALLRFCYPVARPKLRNPTVICNVLEAGRKYLMDSIVSDLLELFQSRCEVQPLEMYSLTAYRGWAQQMKIAAKEFLSIPFDVGTYVPEMDMMNVHAYAQLQSYRVQCSKSVDNIIQVDTQEKIILCDSILATEPNILNFGEICPWISKCIHPENKGSIFFKKSHSDRLIQRYNCPRWFLDYLVEVNRRMRNTPHSSLLPKSTASVEVAFAKAKECCDGCRKWVPSQQILYSFHCRLFAMLQHWTSQVSADFEIGPEYDSWY